jgi:hypothetical protein
MMPGGGSLEKLHDAFRDVLRCLEVVNREINGPTPSERDARQLQRIDPRVAYAIASIVEEGRGYALSISGKPANAADLSILRACWAISLAWCQILAGDIDSIRDSIRDESLARGFGDVGRLLE